MENNRPQIVKFHQSTQMTYQLQDLQPDPCTTIIRLRSRCGQCPVGHDSERHTDKSRVTVQVQDQPRPPHCGRQLETGKPENEDRWCTVIEPTCHASSEPSSRARHVRADYDSNGRDVQCESAARGERRPATTTTSSRRSTIV